ncbi:endoplasmic reticulum junction formation protein lunapark-A-like [Nomia melanderi]|uniref:endoplasmic reticulum junction formation protein lunapark-A-like n=1 Tax=Nomia melanderi TaxID=2448451 RepID=UPI00130426B1|nr:endoplasmic reticulum junction formation protein lunapark-A-like [Nomia melanderi]
MMSILLSRFREKKTTTEILENLDSKIEKIEKCRYTTERRHKRIVANLILYSVILYIISVFIFYFCFFPTSLYDQILYITPLLIFPIVILLTKKMVTWYYKRKIYKNHEKLCVMQWEKEKILAEVTKTETYEKAKQILLKFAPDQLKMRPLSPFVSQLKSVKKVGLNGTPSRKDRN